MALKNPPYLFKAVKYVGDDMLSTMLVTSRPVDFMYDWFERTKYKLSTFSNQMICALFPAMHFGNHLMRRLEGSRKDGKAVRCRYYMRPQVQKPLPDYIDYVAATYPAMHARIHCGVTSLRSSCEYYVLDQWKMKALIRLFLDYVYGEAPNMEDIEITQTSIILHFEGRDYILQQHGEYDRNFDWNTVDDGYGKQI